MYCDYSYAGAVLIALTLGCGIIVKILDIKKYQETWVRHTGTVYKFDKEMLMYILEMEPYDSIYREDEFINRVIAIWVDNLNKFQGNMKQENNMMDIFKFTNKKSSE